MSTFHEDLTMFLLPAISNSHKRALLENNGIRLLEWTRKYKHYAKAVSYYIIHKISTFTFMLPCIVIDFSLNNQQYALITQIYSVIKVYMFRASSLPIIRSFLLYIRHW
jgi:hypothetical protein